MPTLKVDRHWKSQIGYQTGSGSTYAEGGGDISYAVGQVAFIRYFLELPKSTTINSATITFNMVVKDANVNQNSFHTIRAHAIDDSAVLRPGNNEWGRFTSSTTASVSWNPTWVGGGGDQSSTVTVTSIVQELVNRTNWKAGSHIVFTIECTNENGSDMGFRANNDFIFSPYLNVDYTLPVTTTRTDINFLDNPHFDTSLDSSLNSGTAFPGWYQNPHYGTYVDSPNYGTITRDTGFMRIPNTPTMKFTTGTPPAANDKPTGVYAEPQGLYTGTNAVYCGWVFVPSVFTQTVGFEIVYFGGQTSTVITKRDQWVPFCTRPWSFGGDTNTFRFCSLYINPPFQQGMSVWISEPCAMRSDFQQMPWTGYTTKTNITHRTTASKQMAARDYVPRGSVHDGTSAKSASTWLMNDYGLYQLRNN